MVKMTFERATNKKLFEVIINSKNVIHYLEEFRKFTRKIIPGFLKEFSIKNINAMNPVKWYEKEIKKLLVNIQLFEKKLISFEQVIGSNEQEKLQATLLESGRFFDLLNQFKQRFIKIMTFIIDSAANQETRISLSELEQTGLSYFKEIKENKENIMEKLRLVQKELVGAKK